MIEHLAQKETLVVSEIFHNNAHQVIPFAGHREAFKNLGAPTEKSFELGAVASACDFMRTCSMMLTPRLTWVASTNLTSALKTPACSSALMRRRQEAGDAPTRSAKTAWLKASVVLHHSEELTIDFV